MSCMYVCYELYVCVLLELASSDSHLMEKSGMCTLTQQMASLGSDCRYVSKTCDCVLFRVCMCVHV